MLEELKQIIECEKKCQHEWRFKTSEFEQECIGIGLFNYRQFDNYYCVHCLEQKRIIINTAERPHEIPQWFRGEN